MRTRFVNSDDIGVFSKLTNSYCLVATGGSELFYNTYKYGLGEQIPIIHTTIGGCRIIGCLTVGNKNGLLVPDYTTDAELQHLVDNLPETLNIKRIESRHTALGNVIACNDKVALVDADLDHETVDIIGDVLNVEVFGRNLVDNRLVGSSVVLNNAGGMVHPNVSNEDQDELSSLLQLPIVTGTVNCGCEVLAAGMVVNDYKFFVGGLTLNTEIIAIEKAFKLREIIFCPTNNFFSPLYNMRHVSCPCFDVSFP